jgi:hypothetical protein
MLPAEPQDEFNSVVMYIVSPFVSLLFNELPPEQQKIFSMLSEKILKFISVMFVRTHTIRSAHC